MPWCAEIDKNGWPLGITFHKAPPTDPPKQGVEWFCSAVKPPEEFYAEGIRKPVKADKVAGVWVVAEPPKPANPTEDALKAIIAAPDSPQLATLAQIVLDGLVPP